MHYITKIYIILAFGVTAFITIVCTMYKKSRKTTRRNVSKEDTTIDGPASVTQPVIIQSDKASQGRFQRYKNFEAFYDKSKVIFEPYKAKDERTKYLQATHMLTVCPGTRNGGRDKRYVEIFWGSKIYDKNEEITGNYQVRQVFYSETGATMLIYKNDNGYSSIYLKPAGTDISHPHESAICLKKKIDPAKLLRKDYQDRIWYAFMAYMEVTQLDGNPSWIQILYIWYLRNFHHILDNKEWQPVKSVAFIKNIALWSITVSFSGIAIFLFQLRFVPNPAEHNNVTGIKDKAIELSEEVETLHKELKGIRNNQDSLIILQKQNEKVLKKSKQ